MFKNTSDNSQFRMRPKESYSSTEAQRWAFYAQIVYENRFSLGLSSWRLGRIEEVKRELDEIGELRTTLRWFQDTLVPDLDDGCYKQLRHMFFVFEATQPTKN
jgi:hypothetical protein